LRDQAAAQEEPGARLPALQVRWSLHLRVMPIRTSMTLALRTMSSGSWRVRCGPRDVEIRQS
jgi:hypothetical protein